MGVHWKIQFLGEFMKNQYIGGSCLKGGTSTVCKFKSGLGEKKECVFEEGGIDIPMHTMGKVGT